jgi:sugar phosphate isomerase/epimerase
MIRLYNAMWPGLVGKVAGTSESPLSLERMLDLTASARVNGEGFAGVDLFLAEPHLASTAEAAEILELADRIAARGLRVGTLVAPVWPWTGGGSAMGSAADRQRFVAAVRHACRLAGILNQHGIRTDRLIRIDSADSPAHFATDPAGNRQRIIATFREAALVAADHGECLAAEGEVCWAGMHSWPEMLRILEGVGMPHALGFQADLAHTYFYLLGLHEPTAALLHPPFTTEEFSLAYHRLVTALGPWTVDLHIAQTDGTLYGSGEHAQTGRHCLPDDPAACLDPVACVRQWLAAAKARSGPPLTHVCWDGCMFPNAVLEDQRTWTAILRQMLAIRDQVAAVTVTDHP